MHAQALLALTFALAGAGAKFDLSIGGKSANAYHESVYDPANKLYLYSSGDCDGAHRRLVLSSDFESIMRNEGFLHESNRPEENRKSLEEERSRLKRSAIRPETSSGIRLGMSEKQVVGILGKPDRAFFSKKFQARELIYRRETKPDRDGISQRSSNYYLFRNGKLFYVELARDKIGGG
jgi:hypothetical protein